MYIPVKNILTLFSLDQVYSHTSLGKEVAKKFLIIVGYILTGM